MHFLLVLAPVVLSVLLVLLLFPVAGIAMIPVVAGAVLAGLAWIAITLRRGPRALPERHEPDEDPSSRRRDTLHPSR
jgi:hypothetical protein